VHGWLRLGHWHGPVTRLGWLSPAQPEKKRKKENFLKKLF